MPKTVQVTDVIAIRRDAVIPDECPNCNAKLIYLDNDETAESMRQSTIKLYQYQFEAQSAYIVGDEGDIEWGDSDGGDGYLGLSWICRNCNYNLVSGWETEIEPDSDSDSELQSCNALVSVAKGIQAKVAQRRKAAQ